MKIANRRDFLKQSGALTGGLLFTNFAFASSESLMNEKEMFFKISLAEWSFHKAIFAKELDHLDFAAKAKSLGIDGIEYVNQFFRDKAKDMTYLKEMDMRASDQGVKQLLIMIDREGGLGDVDDASRKTAIENHYKWVDAAKFLGCHSIRVNAYGVGSAEDVASAAVEGLSGVAEYAKKEDINVIVENHGGYSSNGAWLANVMKRIDMDNCGTLPDFGNFCTKRKEGSWDCLEEYDKYKGVEEMMPFAKAVSAKANVFDQEGNEAKIDYMRMLKIVKDHGYKGYVGIEYEGRELSEKVLASLLLLKHKNGHLIDTVLFDSVYM